MFSEQCPWKLWLSCDPTLQPLDLLLDTLLTSVWSLAIHRQEKLNIPPRNVGIPQRHHLIWHGLFNSYLKYHLERIIQQKAVSRSHEKYLKKRNNNDFQTIIVKTSIYTCMVNSYSVVSALLSTGTYHLSLLDVTCYAYLFFLFAMGYANSTRYIWRNPNFHSRIRVIYCVLYKVNIIHSWKVEARCPLYMYIIVL